ncbi:hypothetical protein BCR43DRAFT_101602 [Syncephalastrum racemosum]|uniref:Dickkopf N-terminal cysteine-rich domain-containing protein n=1 Tax=Syncephalastrum racemosum TaxID=13706 RepID=A0A1X2H1F1_SYNRA|nr:hypothetical protein BCR43DRAFT_101602 [Syncephalastrum racemosum]
MRSAALFSLICASLAPSAIALRYGEMCDATPIYTASWEYNDSCENIYLFCDPATYTCNYRNCTNTDYVKGWSPQVRPFPQRCTGDTFCPDDNSKCTPKVAIGQKCEMQRDDECTGTNSICLNATCFVKAAPLGGNCGMDTTMYSTMDREGNEVQQLIIRDNCTTGTYCVNDACTKAKDLGAECQQDRECLSEYCSADLTCVNGPDVFHTVPAWLWGVLGTAVVLFVLLILTVLWFLHRYQSKKENAQRLKFFGDNEEFAKYAMLENDDDDPLLVSQQRPGMDSRTSIYLQTPDYDESHNLTRKSWRNSSSALRSTTASPRASTIFGRGSPTPEPRQ